jgi:hypothetical protein
VLSLGDIPQIPGLLSAIFRLIEAHRNEIQAQPASFAANRSGCAGPALVALLHSRRTSAFVVCLI